MWYTDRCVFILDQNEAPQALPETARVPELEQGKANPALLQSSMKIHAQLGGRGG